MNCCHLASFLYYIINIIITDNIGFKTAKQGNAPLTMWASTTFQFTIWHWKRNKHPTPIRAHPWASKLKGTNKHPAGKLNHYGMFNNMQFEVTNLSGNQITRVITVRFTVYTLCVKLVMTHSVSSHHWSSC